MPPKCPKCGKIHPPAPLGLVVISMGGIELGSLDVSQELPAADLGQQSSRDRLLDQLRENYRNN